jgi:hypothetical protein
MEINSDFLEIAEALDDERAQGLSEGLCMVDHSS